MTMSTEEIQELLRKAGVSEDQWKYYTSTAEQLPGLFGFSPFQTERFQQQFGGLGQFDPTKTLEAYGEIERFGEQKQSNIGQQLKTGLYDIQTGLTSGIKGISESIGYKLKGFGAREREKEKLMGSAYESGEELERKRDMGLLNLEEILGARRAAVGSTTQSWLDKLMRLVSSIYQMDPTGTGTRGGTYRGGKSGGPDTSGGYKSPFLV